MKRIFFIFLDTPLITILLSASFPSFSYPNLTIVFFFLLFIYYRLRSDLVILSRDMLSFFFDYPDNLAKSVLAKIPLKFFDSAERLGDMVSHSFQTSWQTERKYLQFLIFFESSDKEKNMI